VRIVSVIICMILYKSSNLVLRQYDCTCNTIAKFTTRLSVERLSCFILNSYRILMMLCFGGTSMMQCTDYHELLLC